MLANALRSAIGGLPSTYWVLWIGTLINRLGSFVVPFLTLYLTDEQHLSAAEAGSIVSLYGLGALVANGVGGVLSDRIGRRATILLGLLPSAAGMVALGLAENPALIALCALLVGFFSELFRPAVSAVIADVVAPGERLRAYAVLFWAANLGFAVAPVLAGVMANRSYLALFLANAVATTLYAILVFVKIPETRPENAGHHHPAASAPESGLLARAWEKLGFAEVARDGVFLSFVGLCFVLAFLFFQHNSTLPLEMRANGLTPAHFGAIISVNGLLIVVLQPFAAKAVARFRRGHVLAVAALLTGLGFGWNAFASSVPTYLFGVVVWTLGEILHSPVASAVVADLAPAHARGRYQGAFYMGWGLAAFAAPVTGGWILERFGAHSLWLTCLLLGLFVAGGQLAIAGARRRRLALHPPDGQVTAFAD